MSNPFHDSLDTFRGRRVRVVSNDGRIRVGWLERMEYRDRHVVLRDARDPTTDQDLGRAFVSHVDTMDIVDDVDKRVERVALDAIDPSPLHVREFDIDSNRGYIKQVRDQGWVGSYPTVRERRPGQFECVHGHKRLWVAEQARLGEHPVVIVDIDEFEAAQRYVIDHHPGLTASQRQTVVKRLVSRFGEQNLPRFPLVDDVLGTDETGEGGGRETDDTDTGGESPPEAEGDNSDSADTTSNENAGSEVDDDLTAEEAALVDALAAHGEQSPADLQDLTDQGHSVYERLRRLHDAGVVDKRKDPDDGRRTLYRLTDDGAAPAEKQEGCDESSNESGGDAGDQEDPDEGREGDAGEDDDGSEDTCEDAVELLVRGGEEIDADTNGGGPDGRRHRLARRVVVPRRRRRERRPAGPPRHARVARGGRRPRGAGAGYGRDRRPAGLSGG